MNKRVIFSLEGRAGDFIYHWFLLMISGLRHIGKDSGRFGPDGLGAWEQNEDQYDPSTINPPYNITFGPVHDKTFGEGLYGLKFHNETLDIIKDKYKLVETPSADDIVINNFGEQQHFDGRSNNFDPENYKFLYDLFNERMKYNDDHKDKKYFISRNNSHNLSSNAGLKRRQLLNEDELYSKLKEHGIEKIYLEDYSLKEKINIFHKSSLIISPNSGGLLFSLFCKHGKIVELNVPNPTQLCDQYSDICNIMKVPYHRFHTHKADPATGIDNMIIDIDEFIEFLKTNDLI
tara:strand:+ start:198 stop:1067 length:870 start_codon:yes stop_codon:yes gene_type:complete